MSFIFKDWPPDLALSALSEMLSILDVGIQNPANQADGTKQAKAKEITHGGQTMQETLVCGRRCRNRGRLSDFLEVFLEPF